MATSTSATDYFASRPALRSAASALAAAATPGGTPASPRTPLLGRSISGYSGVGSPGGSFRIEQEEYVIYELGSRHLSAGFAGESRPRCRLGFGPETGRRVGDYRSFAPGYRRKERGLKKEEQWGEEYELFKSDLRTVDLGLVEDKLERAVRKVHTDHLQLDQKPRKAVLVVPSLLPTSLLEIALKVLFGHFSQPPSVMLMTPPIPACVGAGVRNVLVFDVGWEETVATAVGEYKEIAQRRSVRAGKMLTREMARVLEAEVKKQEHVNGDNNEVTVSFEYAEEVTQRMGWCRQRSHSERHASTTISLPSPDPDQRDEITVPFATLSTPAETALFTPSDTPGGDDDHNLPLHTLAHRVLLTLPIELRALCISRIVLTGGVCCLPGLKTRLLQELKHLVETRGWDPVHSYGSATTHHNKVLLERSGNIEARKRQQDEKGDVKVEVNAAHLPLQQDVPHRDRIHDDKYDPLTQKAERGVPKTAAKMKEDTGVRGVETLGAWAGASLVASLRVKGVHEVEREEFLKYGLKDEGGAVI